MTENTTQGRRDGVKLALVNNRLQGIARKMSNTLARTGRSGVLNIARDFSCCIVSADDELVAAAESLPIHVLSGPDLMSKSMKELHPGFLPGDVFLHNSPYHGCSHPADHTLLAPVFDAEGKHRFTILVKAHQADCGNSQPTTYMGTARDVYEEGALIFPCVRVQRQYELVSDVIRMCELRIRVPEQWRGDFLAMLGSVRIGEQELLALGQDLGWDALEALTKDYLDYSEERMIAALRQLPRASAERSSTHDPIPGTPPDGITVKVTVRIDPDDARVHVDLTDNDDCYPCGLNLSESCARTAAMIGIFNSIDATIPKNAGAFRRIDVQLREGCVVGVPRHPTSCSVATTNLADRVTGPVQVAMADISASIGAAECGPFQPPSVGVLSGVRGDSGDAYVNQVFLGFTGGGAGPRADAWQLMLHAGNGGQCLLDSVELDELRMPVIVTRRQFVIDSEGAGQYRGASSLVTEFGPLSGKMTVAYVADGSINPAQGARGGGAGGATSQVLLDKDGQCHDIPVAGNVDLVPGETIRSVCAGGGGYGVPKSRAVAAVIDDVRERWISHERALSVYGVDVQADASGGVAVEARK
ncbi:MAG: hydantoinase B/oxoprolinase family protein [Burkholderia sp.]|uniref:hydantoinase B/oxoprolinase family protein n=3 Tax=Burkholderiaceae TaxID=119060 RepID=UPI001CF22B06|nr:MULTISPECIES: hydantoinase B/oxoprolinase family protein [Burkholderia]MCA3783322.1 hydantoinase B/oxoprolinase family protein [Burkholderia sp.]MCA3796230.1 hydantoinase B/oxoprolinase family protein [Burkholderia sp.]MCA3807325.1 hydantoinase B/oxoprolinase family protein [Burkholderia sp.]MCA3817496.1 hydantoinase B/oxoprolinase family protein [Burkholderia sp.]MCA3831406.1 hydantoinase B/oxoprolinase family protein [Burkholderia sp.]